MFKQLTPKEKIAVFGLGYIGLPILAAFASRGCQVIGVDVDRAKINRLKKSYLADFLEPGLNETLLSHKERITFTSKEYLAVKECQTIVITVGTPVALDGRPDFHYLDNVVSSIGKHLRPGQLLIFKSTIMPGITRKLAERLQKLSGLQAGTDFSVAFSPERTVEGRALKELYTLPKVVGGINKESLKRGKEIIGKLGGKVVEVSSLELAEMCKCIDNTYRVANIAFANEVGQICEKAHLNSYELVQAVNKAYPRNNLFLPGLGAGGPCLSKDPEILKYFANQHKVETTVIDAVIARSRESTSRLIPIVSQFIKNNRLKNPKIALAGLAFKGKPETDDIRNSPALELHTALTKQFGNLDFSFYDPKVKKFLGYRVAESWQDCVRDSHIVMFLTNHPTLLKINTKDIIGKSASPLLIVDCWHNLKNHEKIRGEKINIFRIGDSNGKTREKPGQIIKSALK